MESTAQSECVEIQEEELQPVNKESSRGLPRVESRASHTQSLWARAKAATSQGVLAPKAGEHHTLAESLKFALMAPSLES